MAATNTGDWNWNPQPAALPAARAASSAAPSAGERHQHAGGVGDGLPSRLAARRAGQTDHLHRQHREHAGHQVEDQPAQEREPQHALQPQRRRRRRHRTRGGAQHHVGLPARCGRAPTGCRTAPSSGRNALPGRSASVKPPCQTVSGCAAPSRIAPARIGDEPGIGHGGRGQLRPVHQQRPVARRSRAGHGDGRGTCRSSAANSGACADGAAVPDRQVEPEIALLRHADVACTPASSRAP